MFGRAPLSTAKLVIFSVLLLPGYTVVGCKTERATAAVRLPPGDWTGRCPQQPEAKSLQHKGTSFRAIDDRADILEPAFEAELGGMLSSFHAETCHQIAVVTIHSLEGRTVEQRSLELANEAAYGYAGFNNGVMLLIARNDHKARIEVGCGLEDVISDAQATEIMKNHLIPAFRAGDFDGGIRAGVLELIDLARKKRIPDAYRPPGCPNPS